MPALPDGSLPAPALPAGVTPSQAGRAWAWLWLRGKENHRLALKRRANRKTRTYGWGLVARWARYRAPYVGGMHPSGEDLLHRLTGVGEERARDLVFDRKAPLPAHHARTLADDLEITFAGVSELIAELRRYADHRDAAIGKRLPRRKGEG